LIYSECKEMSHVVASVPVEHRFRREAFDVKVIEWFLTAGDRTTASEGRKLVFSRGQK
jgi:hypothetical protein